MEPIVKFKGINFFYNKGKQNEAHILKDINIEINKGEYVAFYGPSGVGKSSLLYIISGIEMPDNGEIVVLGEELVNLSPYELSVYRQTNIGIIFQNFNLIPSLKNIDNAVLPMALVGINKKEREERMMKIFERLGVAHLANRFPGELSGGQQQRIAIARSMANNPPIILADEPLGNLDSKNAENVLDILRDFHKNDGKTIIVVTHEEWSLKDTDRVFYLRDGEVKKVEVNKNNIGGNKKDGQPILSSSQSNFSFAKRAEDIRLMFRGFSSFEEERLESYIIMRLRGKITRSEFLEKIDAPIKDGGVGLWKQTALRVSLYVEGFAKEEQEIRKMYDKIKKNPSTSIYTEVKHIREWVFKDIKIKFSKKQIKSIDEIISNYIKKMITMDNLIKIFNLPEKKGGIGMHINTSIQIAEKIALVVDRKDI
jgi:putative ABC transport system ATP-binding protein